MSNKISYFKYYFKTTGWDNSTCVEPCNLKGKRVKIGSIACQKCVFCLSYDKNRYLNPTWVHCAKLKYAINKNVKNILIEKLL